MFHRDGFFLARLVNAGVDTEPTPETLSHLSPMFQPVAARLLAAPPHERQPIWENFLGARPNLEPEPVRQSDPVPEPPAPVNPPQPLSADRTLESDRRFRLTCAGDLNPRVVEWLWPGRVPLGMLTMFAGDPKLGKSYVTLAMAAAVSRGLPMPGGDLSGCPGSTVLMSAEDDPARTIVPRLIAAGADLAKVHILESVILANGFETLPSLRADIHAILAEAARLGDCRLVVIDPVSAYLRGIDDNRNAALRGVLAPLKGLAERLGTAVVLVSHLTKARSANRMHRVLGSIAYVGACRANHLFVADSRDPSARRVLMLDNGGNIAPPAPTLAYTIEESDHGPKVVWSIDPVPITAAEALRPQPDETDSGVSYAQECARWLAHFLEDGPKPSVEVFNAAVTAGYSREQVKYAKHRVGAIAQKHGLHEGARWTWQLRPAPSS